MFLIGLTGSIATGKSTVSTLFQSHHFPLIDADLIARQVVEINTPGYFQLKNTFPECVLQDKTIDRTQLANLIFSHPNLRRKLNQILHPLIKMEMFKQVVYCYIKGESICILDAPLLFEVQLHKWIHESVVVYCPVEIELERLMSRNKYTKEESLQRIQSQMSIEEKRVMATHVIDNSDSVDYTKKQVHDLSVVLKSKKSSFWIRLFLFIPCCMVLGLIKTYQISQLIYYYLF